MKKFIFILFILFILLFGVKNIAPNIVCYAEDDLTDKLSDEVNEQINSLDIDEYEEIYEKYSNLEDGNLKSLIKKIIAGDYVLSFENIFGSLSNLVTSSIKNIYPYIISIIVLSVLLLFFKNFHFKHNESLSNIIFYIIFSGIVISIVMLSSSKITSTINTLKGIQNQVEVVSPILLALIIAVGGTNSASIYRPSIIMFAGSFIELFMVLVVPVFTTIIVSAILGNLSNEAKLSKMGDFSSSLYKTIVSFVFTIFIGFLSIQGITASTFDGVSIKTAKFAIRSYVPIVGGYLSDGFEIFRAGSVLIKNSLGVVAIIILFGFIIEEVISLCIIMLSLKFAASIVEPITDSRVSKLLFCVSKAFTILISALLIISLMYFIIIILLVSTANIF